MICEKANLSVLADFFFLSLFCVSGLLYIL